MDIRLAIHHRADSFSERWQAYCAERGIPFAVVDCHQSEVMSVLRSFDGLLWSFTHTLPSDVICARYVIKAAEMMGLAVFPDSATCWHYDDKVAQKYLLEAIGAPLVPTHVFYDPESALAWVERTEFPKVFKLRKGAGSRNVRLVRTREQARSLVRRGFGRGFKPIAGYLADGQTRFRHSRREGTLLAALKRMPSTLARIRQTNRLMGSEAGYVYFQDFIPGNTCDIRVTVIGDRAFAFTRKVRPNDFRASGSGSIDYDTGKIDPKCLTTAFEVTRRVGAQSLAFDFLVTPAGEPLIAEISYCYVDKAVYACRGHWDAKLAWHDGQIWPQDAILDDLLDTVQRRPR